MKYNKRIIQITPECFVYYKKIPSKWKGFLFLYFSFKTILDNQFKLLNFPPKFGVKLLDIENFSEQDGMIKIEFFSNKLLKFPKKNFMRSTKKNPIWLSPFKPDLFYVKPSAKNEKETWVFRNRNISLNSFVNNNNFNSFH